MQHRPKQSARINRVVPVCPGAPSRRLARAAFSALVLVIAGCSEPPVELGNAVYPIAGAAGGCPAGAKPGAAGITDDQSTADGIGYNVRTPANYDPTFAHPLLMVYAPAGRSRYGSERFSGLTRAATAAGFVVAYADHRRLSKRAIEALGTIPATVAANWCIDSSRVFLTGHSDGGTVAMGLAFLPETRAIPAAIAPSGAGIRGGDLKAYSCPEPIAVMVLHSAADTLFPGFGAEAVRWWAACNRCDPVPGAPMANGCVAYANCARGGAIWYCEGDAPHAAWPGRNDALIGFFSSIGARQEAPPAKP